MKPSKIVQALINLEKASEERNIAKNIGQDHAEWLELVYFREHEFPVITYCGNTWIKKPYTYCVHKYDLTPFVYLNKN